MILKINEYDINYIDEGQGTPVLLLHGWGSNYKCFTNLINVLKSKYRVLAIDLPGFGESSMLDRCFCVDDYADVVSDFINKMSLDRVILIGHSYGGRIILKLNSRQNKFSIIKNVLIDAAGIKPKKDFKTKSKIALFKTLKKLSKILPLSNDKKEELENKLKVKFGSADYNSAPKVLQETLVKSVNEDLSSLIKDMKETLLIWGDRDTATPLWMAKKFEKEISNSGLVVLNGGHFSFIDDAVTFLRVISSYFEL